MQTAAPWRGAQTIAGLQQSFEHANVLLQLVAATLFHRGIAYKQNPGTCIQQHHSQTLHGNVHGCSHPLNFYGLSQPPGLSVPPARRRRGAVGLLDCPLQAPVPIRGRPGSVTQSTAGSQPCLPALLDAFPTAHSACLPSCVLSTHHRLQIPQHKKGL